MAFNYYGNLKSPYEDITPSLIGRAGVSLPISLPKYRWFPEVQRSCDTSSEPILPQSEP